MSSAALQPAAIHYHQSQSAALTPPLLAPSPFSGQSSPGPTREPYYEHADQQASFPSPSRRSSGRPNAIAHDAVYTTENTAITSDRSKHNVLPSMPPPRVSSSSASNTTGTGRRRSAAATGAQQHQPTPQAVSSYSTNNRSGRDPAHLAASLSSSLQAEPDWDRHAASPPPAIPMAGGAGAGAGGGEVYDTRRSARSRHDPNKKDKNFRLGDYILGNTIGEGEFGKVRLGWKQGEGGEISKQYAIKLIKKDTLGGNPSRKAKIWREVSILKRVTHPNIVKLIDTQDREKYIGIILEYAAGGELFDFILSHRYLKENVARRLFAQLISGVGYLHKKGIVHRDLKLENLLLDNNRNIIITDFGFANTFDPVEALTEEEEQHMSDKDFIRAAGLDRVRPDGSRKSDLMQTSCGSPCYAAPELVISDSIYTGRKVDVWSCGVILYAMLAGYLPFDDDPANPEGDNITQLYRYIIATPLTFPEPVGPGARDLLRRILVPNPRKRADLFEVARHSWLAEFADVIEFITSAKTTPKDIQNSTVPAEDDSAAVPVIARSSSLHDLSSRHQKHYATGTVSANTGAAADAAFASPVIGGFATKHENFDELEDTDFTSQQKGTKRRTVQVEYVQPQSQTRRGDPGDDTSHPIGNSDQRSSLDKPLPDLPIQQQNQVGTTATKGTRDSQRLTKKAPTTSAVSQSQPRASRTDFTNRDAAYMSGAAGRASRSQLAPPEMAGAMAHGRVQRPVASDDRASSSWRSSGVPSKFALLSGFDAGADENAAGEGSDAQPHQPLSPTAKKMHRRSNTLGDIGSKLLGRSGSLFGRNRRSMQPQQPPQQQTEKTKRYPPVSMNNVSQNHNAGGSGSSRLSIDSRRSYSAGFGRKRSGSFVGSHTSQEKHASTPRRFSFLPQSFSLKALGVGRDDYAQHHHPPALVNDSKPDDHMQQPPSQRQRYHQRAPSVQAVPPPYLAPKQPPAQLPPSVEIDSGVTRASVLQKHKRFTDYEDGGRGSGAARRVMALFRIRGRERTVDAR